MIIYGSNGSSRAGVVDYLLKMLRFVFCVIKNSTAHACIMSAILQTIQSMIGLSKLQSLQVLALKPLQTPLSDKTAEMFQ